MFRDRFLKKLFMFGFFAVLVFPAMLGQLGKVTSPFAPLGSVPGIGKAPELTEERRVHILYGDAKGGGHFHGVGKPCASEFPADWSEEDVVETVKQLAANDNLNWKQQKNGNYVAEAPVSALQVRVVLNRDRSKIVTAYPVNVQRNPCNRPANDN